MDGQAQLVDQPVPNEAVAEAPAAERHDVLATLGLEAGHLLLERGLVEPCVLPLHEPVERRGHVQDQPPLRLAAHRATR